MSDAAEASSILIVVTGFRLWWPRRAQVVNKCLNKQKIIRVYCCKIRRVKVTCVGAEGGFKIREAPVCSDSGEGLLREAETDPESHSEGPARDKRGL